MIYFWGIIGLVAAVLIGGATYAFVGNKADVLGGWATGLVVGLMALYVAFGIMYAVQVNLS